MSTVSAHAKLIGSLVAGIVAALSFAYPQYAAEFVGASTTILAALHVQRPGDVKDSGQ